MLNTLPERERNLFLPLGMDKLKELDNLQNNKLMLYLYHTIDMNHDFVKWLI
jgi:hypothetical protein